MESIIARRRTDETYSLFFRTGTNNEDGMSFGDSLASDLKGMISASKTICLAGFEKLRFCGI